MNMRGLQSGLHLMNECKAFGVAGIRWVKSKLDYEVVFIHTKQKLLTAKINQPTLLGTVEDFWRINISGHKPAERAFKIAIEDNSAISSAIDQLNYLFEFISFIQFRYLQTGSHVWNVLGERYGQVS